MFGGPESVSAQYASEGDFTAAAIKRATSDVGSAFKRVTDAQRKKGTITGGLRAANSNSTQSRMSLPLKDVAQSGALNFGSNVSAKPIKNSAMDDLDLYTKLSDRSLQDRGAMGNQDIDLTKRKIKEVDTLANNEANRAMSMSLATQFPYKKYETESSSARDIMNNSQAAIPTFLNRATASRINPVSLSL